MDIIGRAAWGAKHAAAYKGRDAPLPAQRVWLHHSATIAPDLLPPFDDDDAAVRALERIGQQRFRWGISYTFAVTPAGRVYEGHRIDGLGAHTGGDNTHSRAICLVGDYDQDRPSTTQIAAVAELLRHGKARGWWRAAALAGGHRDAPGASTACPGRYAHDLIGEINRLAADPTTGAGVPTPRTLRLTTPFTRGADVAELQRLLRIPDDGIFGGDTDRTVRAFQAAHLLAVDGVVGPATWAALRAPAAPPPVTPSPVPREVAAVSWFEPSIPDYYRLPGEQVQRRDLPNPREALAHATAHAAAARDNADRAHTAAILARDEAYTARQELAALGVEVAAQLAQMRELLAQLAGQGGDPRAFAAAVAADLAARLAG